MKNHLEGAAKLAKHLWDKDEDKEIIPMWVLFHPGGAEPVITPWKNADEKRATSEIIRQRAKELNAHALWFMCEAWSVETDTDRVTKEDAMKVIPSQHEDRREIVHVHVETADGIEAGMYYILRPEHGKPTLSPFKRLPDDGVHSGRFMRLLDVEREKDRR